MSDLEKFVRNTILGGIGAVSAVAETVTDVAREFVKRGDEISKVLVERGEKALKEANEMAEEMQRKADEELKKAMDQEVQENLENMTKDERDELRRKLDEIDKKEAEAKKAIEAAENIIVDAAEVFQNDKKDDQ